jgi:hypothetical protein
VRQYRNLGLIFIVMNAIWMYFTYAEFLTLAAGQQAHEFPVFASKLWGEYAPSFWLMIALMTFAFWVMVVPLLLPEKARQMRAFQPRVAVGALLLAVFTAIVFFSPDATPLAINTDSSGLRFFFWLLLAAELLLAGLGLAAWLKPRPVAATTLAALAVLIGMWLERWIIIVPTLVRPLLVNYGNYQPTLTEISLLAASVALFIFLLAIIFKLVPVVSIWEIAEGRVIDAAEAAIPMPEPSTAPRRGRLRQRRAAGD